MRMRSASPGPWLRLTALAAAGATLLAVVSGAAGLDAEHRILAALAIPPLVALVVAAWLAHRRLLPSALAALVLFGAAAVLTSPVVHVTAAALSFAAAVIAAAATFRGERARHACVGDYVARPQPRRLSLL